MEKNRKFRNDVGEERSVFLVGITMSATEELVKSKLETFGKVNKVIFCMDRETGNFKGTGFAEFETKEAAMECVDTSGDPAYKQEFMIDGQVMKCLKALPRKDPKLLDNSDSSRKQKDKRNIYLAREGVVREGTHAAEGVSKFDLSVRVQRERLKHKLLANLHCFVSPTRLFFCNIPESISDSAIRAIFKDNSPKESIISGCKIMRDLMNIGDDGGPKSKGFGFINFSEHTHALAALRAVNNNPLIFSKNKRPIVEFSIENKAALNAKLKREQKSKANLNKNSEPEEAKFPAERTPVKMNNSGFVGGKAKQGMKLATHFGAKICKKSGKITRNQVNNKVRKQRKNQKKRITKNKKERNDVKVNKNKSRNDVKVNKNKSRNSIKSSKNKSRNSVKSSKNKKPKV